MAKILHVELSENGWEYTGVITITCKDGTEWEHIPNEKDYLGDTLKIGDVTIKFDEEITVTERMG